MKVKKQIKSMRKLMDTSISTFFNSLEEDEENVTDDFYNSYFTFSFCDKHTKQKRNVEIFICPDTWEMAQNFLKELEETLEDYED